MNQIVTTVSRVPLDSLLKEEDIVAMPGFQAEIGGRLVHVTAVLERTVVYEPAPGEPKELASRRNCLVEPDRVTLRPLQGPAGSVRRAARRGLEASRRHQRNKTRAA
jgi:hypothetical protein